VDGHRGPFSIGSGNPISDVFNGSVSGGGSGTLFSGGNDFGTSFSDFRVEETINPFVVNLF